MKKILAVIFLAVCLCLPCFAGCALTESGMAEQGLSVPAGSGVLVSEEETSSGRAKLSAQALTASDGSEMQLLTVVVEPSYATNRNIVWSMYWENGESAWASGKDVNDYLELLPTSEGAQTATLRDLQPFGEAVIVKVTAEDSVGKSDEVYDTCRVDYLVRDYETTLAWVYDDGSYDFEFINADELQYIPLGEFSVFNDWTQPTEIIYSDVKTGTGTKMPETENREVYIRLNEGFSVALADAGVRAYTEEEEWLVLYDADLYVLLEKICGQYYFFDYPMGEPNEGNWQKFLTAVGNNKNVYDFELKIVSEQSGGAVHETIYRCQFNRASSVFCVREASLAGDIVF